MKVSEECRSAALAERLDEGYFAMIMVLCAEGTDSVLRYRAGDRNIDRMFLLFMAELFEDAEKELE